MTRRARRIQFRRRMPSILLLRDRLTFLLGFFFGGLWFLLCSALGVVWLLLRPGNRQTLYVYGRVFCRGLVRMMGWNIQVENRSRLDDCRPCVIVANHQSIADVVTFGAVLPQRTVSAGKRRYLTDEGPRAARALRFRRSGWRGPTACPRARGPSDRGDRAP